MEDEKGLESLQVWQKFLGLAQKEQTEILPLFPSDEKSPRDLNPRVIPSF
jgi:hypothetical protein